MISSEIVKLTRANIARLLRSHESPEGGFLGHERRRSLRWPFPGTVELRPVGGREDDVSFGSCRDVSATGVGITAEGYFEPGTCLEISMHLPEASFYGQATVRYCEEIEAAEDDPYAMGLEFQFEQ